MSRGIVNAACGAFCNVPLRSVLTCLVVGASACDRSEEALGEHDEQAWQQESEAESTSPETVDQQTRRQGVRPYAKIDAPPAKNQLKQFAKAYREVRRLNDKYAPLVSEASDSQNASAIQREASNAMAAAVSEARLTANEYSRIAGLVEKDPALARLVTKYMHED